MIRVDDDPVVATEAAPAPAPIEQPKPKRRRAKPASVQAFEKAKAKANGARAKAKPKLTARSPVKGTTKGRAPTKVAKPKRRRDPNKLDEFGYRKGSVRSKAAHLYASKKGATLAEVKAKLGGVTQYNVLTELQARGFPVKRAVERNRNGREVIRFYVQAR